MHKINLRDYIHGSITVYEAAKYPPMTNQARWTFNGRVMTITEFAEKVYGDTPQRTEFLLRYGDDR